MDGPKPASAARPLPCRGRVAKCVGELRTSAARRWPRRAWVQPVCPGWTSRFGKHRASPWQDGSTEIGRAELGLPSRANWAWRSMVVLTRERARRCSSGGCHQPHALHHGSTAGPNSQNARQLANTTKPALLESWSVGRACAGFACISMKIRLANLRSIVCRRAHSRLSIYLSILHCIG